MQLFTRWTRLAVPPLLALVAGVWAPGAGSQSAAAADHVDLQILAINDFHGNLEPPAGGGGRILVGPETQTVDAGGAVYLAEHIRQLESGHDNSVVVSAGDLVGASPLISALFNDEPTIEAMNQIGLDFNAVGNHEFDDGQDELLRLQRGGCHPTDGCQDGDDFEGADFRFLAANVVRSDTGYPVLPAYRVRVFDGIRVAFVGMTLEATPSIVTPTGIQNLDFRDEADTVNALIPRLQQRGIEAVIVLIHEGGIPTGRYNECPGISGPIVDIVGRMDPEVDAVISGHTHQAYNCAVPNQAGVPIPVTSAASFGRLVTDIDLVLDRGLNDVVYAEADNRIVTRTVTPDANVGALVDRYRTLAAPLAGRVIGAISADITRVNNAAGESALGDVIADAQLLATTAPEVGGAQVAFMNPGGIRADLVFASSPRGEGDGNVTYEEAFTTQPFGNTLSTVTLTGAQIELLLEQQWLNQPFPRILQPSEGFAYSYDPTRPVGDFVDPATITLGGQALDLNASYRVTVNSFLAGGGDGFSVLTEGSDVLGGPLDLDALESYLQAAGGPVPPGPQDRITRLN